jgi:hypothetical protein
MTSDELNQRSEDIARQAEAKHTPEPWRTSDDQTLCRYGQHSVHGGGEGIAYEISRPENAARIVACINYCAGLDSAQLDGTATERIGGLEQQIAELEAIGANDYDSYMERLHAQQDRVDDIVTDLRSTLSQVYALSKDGDA